MTDQTQTTTEPVAWGCFEGDKLDENLVYRLKERADNASKAFGDGVHLDVRPLYTTPQPLAIGLDREAVARVIAAELCRQEGHECSPEAVIFDAALVWHYIDQGRVDFGLIADAILALAAPADGYVLVPVEPELDADMERDLTESDQEAIERGLRTIRAFDAVRDLRSVLSDTMTRQHSGYDWNADSDGMTLRQSEAIKQADRALPAAPTGGRS